MATLLGCGNNRRPSSDTDIANVAYMEIENIQEPELSIAKRVCYAYKSKRSMLKTNYHNSNFSFDVSKKDCNGVEISKTLLAKLNAPVEANTLTWLLENNDESSFQFITNVQDDQSGFLKQLCERIFRGTTEVSNSLPLTSTETIQIQFTRSNIDQYRINYFNNINNVQVLMSSDLFKVRTQFDFTAGQILGFDEEIMRFKKCDQVSKYFEYTHKYQAIK